MSLEINLKLIFFLITYRLVQFDSGLNKCLTNCLQLLACLYFLTQQILHLFLWIFLKIKYKNSFIKLINTNQLFSYLNCCFQLESILNQHSEPIFFRLILCKILQTLEFLMRIWLHNVLKSEVQVDKPIEIFFFIKVQKYLRIFWLMRLQKVQKVWRDKNFNIRQLFLFLT